MEWFIKRWHELAAATSVKDITSIDIQEFRTYWDSSEIKNYAPAVLDGLYSCPFWLGTAPVHQYKCDYKSRDLHWKHLVQIEQVGPAHHEDFNYYESRPLDQPGVLCPDLKRFVRRDVLIKVNHQEVYATPEESDED